MENTEREALLLGSGVTALGTLRCLAKLGIRASVVSDGGTSYKTSRFHREAPPLQGRELPEYLEGFSGDGAILIPCSDRWVRSVAGLPNEILERFPASVPPIPVLDRFLDKGLFSSLLREKGIPHPKTTVVEDGTDIQELGPFDGFFIKPRDSQTFQDRMGEKAFWPESGEEFLEKLDCVREEGIQVMVQEYIPGPASNHFFVDGFLDAAGEVKGVFARRRLRMHPPKFGNSSYMVSIRRWEIPQAVEGITGLLQGLGYRGVFSAEFKWDHRDGQFKLIEVNARPWWFVEFAANCGVNFLRMIYDDAMGDPVDAVEDYREGKYFVHPYYDVSACLREGPGMVSGLFRFVTDSLGSDRPIFRWTDPSPALREFLSLTGNFLGRRIIGGGSR